MVTTRSQTAAGTTAPAQSPSSAPLNSSTATTLYTRLRHRRHSDPQTRKRRLITTTITTAPVSVPNTIPKRAPVPQLPATCLPFLLQPAIFGLIQERIYPSLYALLVQAILWNQTRGAQARPILFALLTLYPDPLSLARADLAALTALLHPLGLHNIRAARLIAFADAWLASPPSAYRRFRRLHYPRRGDGVDVRAGEVLEEADERVGWEVAHLPGMGAYALDSFRIFGRDRLREAELGVTPEKGAEEWRSVLPLDKDLRAYLVWRWREEGWEWDMLTGKREWVGVRGGEEVSR